VSTFSFSEAILSGRPFRHVSMRNLEHVWFKIHSDTEIHVLGPDDILPMDEAIPLEWRVGPQFILMPETWNDDEKA
jgi:hypothetical protein